MADRILRYAVKGVASGIGLASEGVHHHKERKDAKGHLTDVKVQEIHTEAGREGNAGHGSLEEGDEEHWDLDEAQDELISVHSNTSSAPHPEEHMSKRDQINPVKITDAFMRRHPLPETPPQTTPSTLTDHGPNNEDIQVTQTQQVPKLPLPVILPQRRPKARERGFIRAYAPDLAIKGIDQETFLDFIETFNQASLASPWLDAINLAGFATMALPPAISQAVQLAITVSVNIAKDIQSRKRQNTFLDRINDEFFRPRGLYCLVLTWQPDTPTLHTSVDVTSTVAERVSTPHGTGAKIKRAMKTSSGPNTVEFTECAALVFPKLDELAVQTGDEAERKRDKVKHYKGFADVYFDRRAQAKHAGKNPDSALAKLNAPTPKFTSRYADPNHPASNGNLISLLTGGRLNPPDLRQLASGSGGGFGGRGGMGMGGFGGLGSGGGRMGMMGGGGFAGGRMGYGQDQYYRVQQQQQYQYQGTYQQRPGQQGGYYENQSNMPAMGMGGFGGGSGPVGLEALAGAILGIGLGNGQSAIKRILSKDVLYLMIVNMPSAEELAAAQELSEMHHGED
ncbi:uncharacterized protein PV07_11797 [Cladophialophora immunda]|uniref:Uncharacterized protein n=1 Tax=Cladophialophora immunda TaxID=569365 RepID=A0A0D2BZ68_9EURO|nr:uncharacterized protein PV07_11797 [Cladophialophora immunda]KIW23610.1 hypothetical protein PV07_11797 [Cladophialophora immunda]